MKKLIAVGLILCIAICYSTSIAEEAFSDVPVYGTEGHFSDDLFSFDLGALINSPQYSAGFYKNNQCSYIFGNPTIGEFPNTYAFFGFSTLNDFKTERVIYTFNTGITYDAFVAVEDALVSFHGACDADNNTGFEYLDSFPAAANVPASNGVYNNKVENPVFYTVRLLAMNENDYVMILHEMNDEYHVVNYLTYSTK